MCWGLQPKDAKKAKFQLGVAEPKLGSAIQEATQVLTAWGNTGQQQQQHSYTCYTGGSHCMPGEYATATTAAVVVCYWLFWCNNAGCMLFLPVKLDVCGWLCVPLYSMTDSCVMCCSAVSLQVPCVCNEFIGELLRGIRLHFTRFLDNLKDEGEQQHDLRLKHSAAASSTNSSS